MLIAQSLGEYGSLGGLVARITTTVESLAQWVQLSLREDRELWIAVALIILIGFWFSRRR